MKMKLFSLFSLIILSLSIVAQPSSKQIPRSDLPLAVRDGFKVKFPNNPRAIWKNEKPNEYECEVKLEEETIWVVFDQFGIVICTKNSIPEEMLPPGVMSTLKGAFEGYKITEPKKVEHTQHSICFETLLTKGEEKHLVLLDPVGNVISKEEKKN